MSNRFVTILFAVFIFSTGHAQTDTTLSSQAPLENSSYLFDMSIEELLGLEVVDKRLLFYGYINTYAEKTFHVPVRNSRGETEFESVPFEWTPARNFHLYASGNLNGNIDVLINLARTSEDGLELRNAWGNFKVKNSLQLRMGKIYRRFGLYNEKLDQMPTFIGIEPPELFDVDHLFLTRTTNLMLHGTLRAGKNELLYAITTENGEGGAARGVVPLGWDVRYKTSSMIVGTSGFTSSISANPTTSTINFGSGSPKGGVLPWMEKDHFGVYGAYLEKQVGHLLIQSEYWLSPHNAVRNPDHVLTMVREAGINSTQRERFLGASSGKADSLLTTADVVRNASYLAQTWYVRLGYNINTKIGQMVPYVFADWMSNPEVINNKRFGGDEESGFADNGIFFKPSIGLVYRPIQNVAIKIDGSIHSQKFNGKREMYPELRMDFSFAFKQWQQ